MDLRRFFMHLTWWGKLIGAFLGYLIAGPAGALFGILIGNFFDKGLSEHANNPFWYYHAEKRKVIKQQFFKIMFEVMGHISKADGHVSKDSILLAKTVMQQMNLDKEDKIQAQIFFNEGKKLQFDLNSRLNILQNITKDNSNLLKLFIHTQYQLAQEGGLSSRKINIMNIILNHMHYAPINQQSHTNNSYTKSNRYVPETDILQAAYSLLQIPSSSNKTDTKRAYRRLMSRNHPDKLIAQNASIAQIKHANDVTQRIRKAYEQICLSKGW